REAVGVARDQRFERGRFLIIARQRRDELLRGETAHSGTARRIAEGCRRAGGAVPGVAEREKAPARGLTARGPVVEREGERVFDRGRARLREGDAVEIAGEKCGEPVCELRGLRMQDTVERD